MLGTTTQLVNKYMSILDVLSTHIFIKGYYHTPRKVMITSDMSGGLMGMQNLEKELIALLQKASSVKVEFDSVLVELAEQTGADVMLAPVKSFARAMEKVCADYNGDAGRLKDAVRGTLVVATAGEAQALLAKVADLLPVQVKRNWLVEGAKVPSPMYRDILVYVTVQGVICELQINTQAMVQAKDYGHRLYEGQRSLVAQAHLYADELDSDEFKAMERLVRRQIQIYTDAWQRSQ